MYRKRMMEQKENDQFVARVANIPVVSTAWTQACGMYQRAKDSNAVFRTSLTLAENSVKTITETTKPYVEPYLEKYQPQIDMVNNFACNQLEKLEEKYPSINKPTEQLLNDGKALLQPTLNRVQPAVDTVKAVQQYGSDKYTQSVQQVERVKQMGQNAVSSVQSAASSVKELSLSTVNRTLETPYGQFVVDKVSDALTLSEDYVEKYLPPCEEENQPNDTEETEMEMDEYPLSPVTRARHLTTKVRRRLYKRALKELKTVQLRSQENLQKFNFTIDLIQYAKTSMDSAKGRLEENIEVAQNKVMTVWADINSEEDSQLPDTLEGKTIGVARHLTRQLQQTMKTVTCFIPESFQPSAIQERLKEAQTFTEELYQSFQQVKSYEEVPAWVLSQAKEKMSYLQETLGFLKDTLITQPINWLVSRDKVEKTE